ncbi:MAG: hypothetical protein R3E50_07050 [Halioglobus sp.]
MNDELRAAIAHAISQARDFDQLLESIVDTYFQWGRRMGPLAGPIYREIHDSASPASAHRLRLLNELMAIFLAPANRTARITTEPLLYDAAMHLVEHLGHTTFWPQPVSKKVRLQRRAVILQALHAILEVADETGR